MPQAACESQPKFLNAVTPSTADLSFRELEDPASSELDSVPPRELTSFAMLGLPLIERELRVALRRLRPVQTRLKIAALAAGGSVLFLSLGALFGGRSMGRSLEQVLCLAGLYFVFQVPLLTAGVLSEERRNQTLGLLFLTGLGPWQVFVSKFLTASLVAFANLLAIFPMLAIPFLLGGISFDLFLATIVALPALMFFALAISLLGSVLVQNDSSAVLIALVVGGLLCVGTPAIYLARSQFAPGSNPSSWWLMLSPAYGPYLVWHGFHSGFRPNEQAEFWRTLALSLAWSISALVLAALVLNRVWRELDSAAPTGGWRQRWRDFVHGSTVDRRRLARRWLNANPFVWLVARDRLPATLGWTIFGGSLGLWLICSLAWPRRWPSVPNFFVTATFLNSAIAWLMRHSAAWEIGQARREGSYELLLTTPLDPKQIVLGALDALHARFRLLANCLLLVNTGFMLWGLVLRPWSSRALYVYFMVWLLLLGWSWSIGHRMARLLPVMWASLNCGRPARAVWLTSGINGWSWIWVFYNLQALRSNLGNFPSGSIFELFLVSFAAVVWLLTLLGRTATGGMRVQALKWNPVTGKWPQRSTAANRAAVICETRLVAEFREIVREPLPDPTDPRFKKWNVQDRFPWGWELVQQQLHERLVRKSS